MTKKDAIFLGLLVLLTAAVFLNGLKGAFIYDDYHYILNNKQVSGEDSIFGCATPSDRPYLGLYRPLVILSYRLNRLMGGFSPLLFHETSVLLHVLCVLALYFLVRALSGSAPGAFLGALFFGLHPVHAEAVSWIVGRAELMAALFCLLCALCHLGSRRRRWLLGPAGLFFLAACLSKENAFAFPLVLLLMDFFFPASPSGGGGKRKRFAPAPYILYGAVLAGVAVLRVGVLGSFGPPLKTTPYGAVPLAERIPIALSILAESLRLFVFPAGMRIFYHASEMRALTPLRIVVLALFLLLLLGTSRKGSPLLFWLLWIPAALVTVLNIVPIGAVFAERFLYLPSAGAMAAAGLWMSRFCGWEPGGGKGRGAVWIPAAAALILAGLTLSRNPVYHNAVSLWEDAVAKADFPYTHYNLGESYYEEGRLDYSSPKRPGAVAELEQSLAMDPHHPYAFAAHATLGKYYLRPDRRNLAKAVEHFRAATENPRLIAIHPRLVEVYAELARIALETKGELVGVDEGLEDLRRARDQGFKPRQLDEIEEGLKALGKGDK